MNIKSVEAEIKLHDGSTMTATDEHHDEGIGAVLSAERKQMVVVSDDTTTTYIPFHAIEGEEVTVKEENKAIVDDTCVAPEDKEEETSEVTITFSGVGNTTLAIDADFDVLNGVSAVDGDGNALPITASPSKIDTSVAGKYVVEYTAFAGETAQKARRTVTVK